MTPADISGVLAWPGWTMTLDFKTADEMPISGALTASEHDPRTKVVRLYALCPWPRGEDIWKAVLHEVSHARGAVLEAELAPLMAL